jgi:hypothetical protein
MCRSSSATQRAQRVSYLGVTMNPSEVRIIREQITRAELAEMAPT